MQIDLLAEINQSPRILSEVDGALKSKQMKADVDEYLKVFSFGVYYLYMQGRLIGFTRELKKKKTATQYSDSCC